ncbi:MAG: UvrD-helicase domain-containing protein [Myxococcales bacterium]|nr:UvrD-helicase domain-containing protein [Myxococcales bacterium]MCB9733096.1 UvrD-helicase domain-containing protein [Deltaproteobacteria bacterium]
MSTAARVRDLVDALNPEQRAAVKHRGGPVLVLAGAGTGKTRVITVRIADLVVEGVEPAHILALTFTNKAAGEMAERVAGFLGHDAARAMTIGTFHSLGLKILEEEARHLGFRRGISLLDAADQAGAVRQCLKQLGIDPKRHDPRVFMTAISNARNAGVDPARMAQNPAKKMIARVYRAYLEWLEAYQALDFDDLIIAPVRLMHDHPEVLEKWRARFRTILVDEYQDTNTAQLGLMRVLASEHRSLCVVGDDDQSIYGWRGADFRNILEFEKHFPDATAIALTQNYRSTGHILAAANGVIGNNTERRVKSLWTDVGEGEKVRVVTCKDPEAEAAFVAAEIRRRASEESRPWHEFGVLFRTSMQTRAIEESFRLAGVPFRLVGAHEFYERKEVKDALSYLRLVDNADDEVSLLRIINFPGRGVGPAAIAALHDAGGESGAIKAALAKVEENEALNKTQREKLAALRDVLAEARRKYRTERDGAAVLEYLCEATGAREAWIRDPTEGPGGHRRWRNIEQLIEGIRNYQERSGGDLRDFLRIIALDSKNKSEEDEQRDAVAFMTLHSAKGLEWPVCFMIGCQEGIIPHQRVLDEGKGDVTEERRLFYVGVTRARRIAYLTLARVQKRFKGTEPSRPSRFLREIPAANRVDEERAPGGGAVEKSEQLARFAALRDRLAAKNKR